MKKKKRLFSFKGVTILMICICWIVPILIIFAGMSISYKNNMIKKTEDLMEEEVKMYAMSLSFKMNEVINLTKDIFYERKLERSWLKYRDNEIDSGTFYEQGKNIITDKFASDSRVKEAFFYLIDNPDTIYPQRSGELSYFNEDTKKVFQQVTDLDHAKIQAKVMDGQIYLLRNIYAITGYEKFATLVIVLDMDKLIGEINGSSLYDIVFFINDNTTPVIYKKNTEQQEEKRAVLEELKKHYVKDVPGASYTITPKDKKYMGFVYIGKQEYFNLCSMLIVSRQEMLSGMQTLLSLIFGLFLVVIPIIWFFLFYFRRNVTNPMEALVKASMEIKDGNIGAVVDINSKSIANEEFSYLIMSFNEMSSQIKYLFDYAYREEIERKEAQILALQSQINPHFLNNTLEMMNWQARMAGDIDVSKMIEALSTLLDHSMNRSKKKLGSLAEEIRCADAYFYIISMRFGQRLQIIKEIDDTLLQTQIPQLILQPILENAVVHGIDTEKRGSIWLKVYERGKRVILQVLNTGKNMTLEEEERIERLLNGQVPLDKEKEKSNSLGIRNVNQRIKLIYGEEYGLTIQPYEEGITAATIEIPKEM
ncbi:MAG: histidine kinase [Acetivibrio sp.]